MKKYLLLIALLAGCNFAFTACSDDDDNADEIDTESAFSEEAMAAYCALNELCDIEELPSNWQSYTAEPTIGYAIDASNPYVRTVYVEDVIEAEDCFRSLGGTIESGQASATFTAGSISYQYTAKNQSDLLATIDCSVPQVPHLTQIRFVPNDAQDDNGLFWFSWPKGKSQKDIYYSLGDVIRDKNNNCWICVRPAIYGKKHKTYWVAICTQEKREYTELFKNCTEVIQETSNHGTYIVPTNLGTNVTSFKHLMILLYAISNPECYGKDMEKYGFGVGLPMRDKAGVNSAFFTTLQNGWKTPSKKVYNVYQYLNFTDTEDIYETISQYGLSIFYKGNYHKGNTLKLWTIQSAPLKGNELTLEQIEDKKFEINMTKPFANGGKYKVENSQTTQEYPLFDIGQYIGGQYTPLDTPVYFSEDQMKSLGFNIYGFMVKDMCITSDPTEKLEDYLTVYCTNHPE